MKFSVCIPNYNYERYLPRTIASVLAQDADLEILVSDNASTDGSVAAVNAIGDPRIRVHVNRRNVGFSGNLDRAARMATGDVMISLSSDDLMRPSALPDYRALLAALGPAATRTVVSSTWDIIDPHDVITGRTGPNPALWLNADRVPAMEQLLGGVPVYRVAAEELLRRCALRMGNPFNFAATAFPRALYEAVEGYGGSRLINPDKWFNWRLLGIAEAGLFVDKALFAYRWHPSNQSAQQQASGALKYLVDEYASTLELDDASLKRSGLSRADLVRAFVKHDIARHGLATLARGQAARAQRIFDFGTSVYPAEMRADREAWALRSLLALGPVGQRLASLAYQRLAPRESQGS